MSRVRGRDTRPELTLRQALWASGLRYRLQARDLPGRPDLVFRSRRVAVFVHGCFWHRHDCKSGNRTPRSNMAFWNAKFEGNVARDASAVAALNWSGWSVVVIWECELRTGEQVRLAVERVRAALVEAAPATSRLSRWRTRTLATATSGRPRGAAGRSGP